MVHGENHQRNWIKLDFSDALPSQSAYETTAVACANPSCRQITLTLALHGFMYVNKIGRQRKYRSLRLIPNSASKPQPEFIPYALREDYEEACSIRDLSPKASATLVRRCLQGMIRDFCGIKDKKTLFDEIQSLKDMVRKGNAPSGVTEESIEAIDQVRSIGNIGAHMEKDIDLIVDVDPMEAQLLIELVEMLFEEWYVARHERKERLQRIREISEQKKEAKIGRPAGEDLLDAVSGDDADLIP
ncbi:DUF4145 domain-containing protein [Novosphingobium kaempferiae]|uniref:DUF4145 domain-containing protein n=1 Tax=Novosphingobium kaempferiae TaxID=2896849 RepID=UPI001E543FCA|nr:DUF4145 domain-containing protein [Novosphingobium kaempferiae]